MKKTIEQVQCKLACRLPSVSLLCKKTILFPLLICLLASYSTPANADNWMGRLPDNTKLGDMSIPGTHDSATGNGFEEGQESTGEWLMRTQENGIGEQWACGIRAFDLRPAVRTDMFGIQTLRICHGPVPTLMTFSAVLDLLCDSLRKNPSEGVIIVMRHEDAGDTPSADNKAWNRLITECLNRAEYKDFMAEYRPDMTLGELRGKILMLSRERYDQQPVGAFIDNWSHEDDLESQSKATINGTIAKGRLFVQDYYETVTKDQMKRKLKSMKTMLDTDTPQDALKINHTSGYSDIIFLGQTDYATSEGYRKNASKTNNAIIKQLKKNEEKRPAGIVMMDYAGVDNSKGFKVSGMKLISAIIDNNF